MKKLAIVFLMVLMMAVSVWGQAISGADLTRGASSRGADVDPSSNPQTAESGNVTALNLVQDRVTDVWQGFYGNVSGSIVLENGAGDAFYDWSLASLTGEIFATRFLVPDWTNINCTNSTQWEEEEDDLQIPLTLIDGVNETFNETSHPDFQVSQKTLSGCRSTRPYNSAGVPGAFWNVLLNTNNTNTVYAAVLAEDSSSFDGGTADFEILVPTDYVTSQSTYYFYAELG